MKTFRKGKNPKNKKKAVTQGWRDQQRADDPTFTKRGYKPKITHRMSAV